MKHFTRVILLMLILIPMLATAQQTEEQQVKKTFDDYKSAILNDKGGEAVEKVGRRFGCIPNDKCVFYVSAFDSIQADTMF